MPNTDGNGMISADSIRGRCSELWTRDNNYYFTGVDVATPNQKQYKYINQYNYIPNTFNFHKVDNEDELYLGVELEIDKGGKLDDTAKLVLDYLGENNVYCKHDGSLTNGFEIVTHPCTLEYHQQLSYDILFKKLSELGYRSHDVNTCGLHVHINRNYFAKEKLIQDLCISKLLYLFEKYWDKVVSIARRDSNHYARRFYLREDETILDMYAKSKNSDKYGVINLQHKNTVEIRIFKGTLNYRTYMATLQFVNQLAKIIKTIDIYNIQSLTWDNISKDFSDDLLAYIEEREDIRKKEKEDAAHNISTSHCSNSSMFSTDSSNWGDLIRAFYDPPQSHPIFQYNQHTQRSQNQRTRYNRNELNQIDIEFMTIEQIEWKIKFIKEDMRRANTMEKQMLQRELQKYTNKLGQLRRMRN
jgi:hypothetical protein